VIVNSSKGDSGSKTAADNEPKTSQAPAAGLGTAVRDGKFEFVVDSIKCGISSVGSDFTVAKPQGEFCKVSVRVTNIGDEAQMLDSSDQELLDAAGRKYQASGGDVFMADESTRDLMMENINPGNTVSGPIYFDVPAGTQPVKIELHDSSLSDGAVVRLK